MHEFSICRELVAAVVEEVDKRRAASIRVARVGVAVGLLRQVVPDYMKEAYALLARGTAAEGSDLEIREVPVTGICGDCGWSGGLSVADFSCRKCGSYSVTITGGKDISLERITVEEETE